MEQHGKFNIILPQGKAKKSFFEMTEEEHREVARRIFEKVTIEAAKVGQQPVIGRYTRTVSRDGEKQP
jgi:hypothetical protein